MGKKAKAQYHRVHIGWLELIPAFRYVSLGQNSRRFISHVINYGCVCAGCGLEGTEWYLECHVKKGVEGKPVIRLFGRRGDQLVPMTIDHIIPKARGGSDSTRNRRVMCRPCNVLKGDKIVEASQTKLVHRIVPNTRWVLKQKARRGR